MKILITGICGFVGATLAATIRKCLPDYQVYGVDCLIRRGSELNLEVLRQLNVHVFHGDLRVQSDIELLPECNWVIDAAANASVLAGVAGNASSRQLMEHNLVGTLNLLEYCKKYRSGFILLSTSRVYSIKALSELPMRVEDEAFNLDIRSELTFQSSNGAFVETLGRCVSTNGINENFSTAHPISLYGVSKLASEALALEYGMAFGFPVWINRCGVLAGAGQFGRPQQGIYTYWIHSHLYRRPLKYIGFKGSGYQVRDCLHPEDLVELVQKQMTEPSGSNKPQISNVSGGIDSAMSLKQLNNWCDERFGTHAIGRDLDERQFDIPWCILDASQARNVWNWQPTTKIDAILDGIASHARQNPGWLDLSA